MLLLLIVVIFLVWPSADPERKILYEIKRHKINKIYMYTRTTSGKKVLYVRGTHYIIYIIYIYGTYILHG